jgi:hypothetical protein
MLETQDVSGLAEFCAAMHPARAAEFLEGLTAAETWSVLRATEPERPLAVVERQLVRNENRAYTSRTGCPT